jgi:hypothetical protein
MDRFVTQQHRSLTGADTGERIGGHEDHAT